MRILKKILPQFSIHYVIYTVLFMAVVFSVVQIVTAATPNPGHPWIEVGDGTFAITGPTVLRTFTVPDANATILTTNALVTVAQGGTGAGTFTTNGVLYGNGTSPVAVTAAGTTGQCLIGTTGSAPSWGSCTSGGVRLDQITAATGTNTINSTSFGQEWQWNSLAGTSAFKLSSTSTAAASNTQKLFEVALSGTNGTSAQTTYGAYISNTHAGTTSTNVGFYATASGGTTANYAAVFDAGNVGIGITNPAYKLQVASGSDDIIAYFSNTASDGGYLGTGSVTSATEFGLFGGAGDEPIAVFGGSSDPKYHYSPYITVDPAGGNVGIGTTTPGATLDVNGTIQLGLASDTSGFAAFGYQTNLGDIFSNGNSTLVRIDDTNRVISYESLTHSFIGNVGIGDASPAAALTVGSGDLFQVNSSGAIAAATGVTSSGTITFSGLGGGGTQCVQVSNTGVLSGTSGACGSATPAWNSISNPTGTQTLTFDDAELNSWTVNSDTETFWTMAANSLTTGKLLALSSSSLSSGSLVDLAVTGTAAASNTQKVLNISTSGANATSSQTTYGGFFSNTHTGTSSTDVGLYATASGGTNNYAAIFDQGRVGVGTTTPNSLVTITQAAVASVGSGSGTANISPLTLTGGAGGATSANSGTVSGGNAGAINLTGGNGGAITGAPASGFGGTGGNINITAGDGGTGTTFGGSGGAVEVAAGVGGAGTTPGTGGFVSLKGGNGGATNASGGNAFVVGGLKNGSGTNGNVLLGISPAFNVRGFVSVGNTNPSYRFDVLNADPNQTASNRVANFSNTGATFDTTSGVLSSYTGYFESVSTRSSGSNALTNIGLYATASGAQTNYAAIFAAGNVGIGDTTPAALFTVGSGDLFQIDGSANTSLFGGADLRFIETGGGTDFVAFQAPSSVASSVTWTLPNADSSGCFQSNGLGVISISSCGSSSPGGSDTQFQYNNAGAFGGVSTFTYDNATDNIIFNDAGGDNDFRMEGDTDANLLFTDASTDRIGIGTATPTSKLHAVGGITSSGSTNNILVSNGSENAYLTAGANVATESGLYNSANASIAIYDDASSLFRYGSGGVLNIDSVGHVGIGTAGPINKLHVYTTSTADGISIDGTSFPSIVLRTSGTIQGYAPFVTTGAGGFLLDSQVGDMGFRSESNRILFGVGASNSAMVVSSTGVAMTGSVGIGDTSPDYILDVENTGVDTNIFALHDSDGECLHNPESGSETVSCSSDARLKTNIVDANSALSYFSDFRIRDYTVIASGNAMTGVIAQEMLVTHPELVTQNNNGFYSVQLPNQWKVIKAIQELHTTITPFADFKNSAESAIANLTIGDTEKESVLENLRTNSASVTLDLDALRAAIAGFETRVAGLEIATALFADSQSALDQRIQTIEALLESHSLDALDSATITRLTIKGNSIFEGQSQFNGLTVFSAGVTFDGVLIFNGQAQFTVPPLFNKDTAGFALVKQGDRRVHITFGTPYMAAPVVNTSIAFDASDNVSDTEASSIFADNLNFVVLGKDQSGFTILLNKPATRDIRFSWTALSVKDPQIFESVIEGLSIDVPPETNTPPDNSPSPDQTPIPDQDPPVPESDPNPTPPDITPLVPTPPDSLIPSTDTSGDSSTA